MWVDHLRRVDAGLVQALESGAVVMHPFVIGELACGVLANRDALLELLEDLPAATVADTNEVLEFIDRHRIDGRGIGYVDVHLLASAALTDDTRLWTRDKRLRGVAADLRLAHVERGAN